jgi:hypothetical protein
MFIVQLFGYVQHLQVKLYESQYSFVASILHKTPTEACNAEYIYIYIYIHVKLGILKIIGFIDFVHRSVF